MNEKELKYFKNLLEYFVSHLDYIENKDVNGPGYDEYIKSYVESQTFKMTGQGYDRAAIQNQIKKWDTYESGQICINVQGNYGTYKSTKCYLNWIYTGINIIAKWKDTKIVALYQDEFNYWEKPPRRVNTGKEYSLSDLGLFSGASTNELLRMFAESYVERHENLKKNEKIKSQMKNIYKSKDLLLYKKQIILQGPPGTGKTRDAELIAKEMLGLSDVKALENNDQYKLVQFHPSYTYEDFVRGIVAKPDEKGNGIIYEAENKTLGFFAQEAYKNYEQSTKTDSQISYKDWIDMQFDSFVDTVQAALDNSGEYRLTDKVKLFDIDDSSFYYTGDSWLGQPKHRMKFSDIKEGFIKSVVDAKSYKALANTSGSAKQHYGYYYKVLNDFQKSIKTEFIPENAALTDPQKYVLVIDEINRANLSSVLGELIYALEYREKAVESIYSVEDSVLDNKNEIILPPNLYIIGTMNTADRSVGHIDYAIRRRFAFVDLLPKVLKDSDQMTFNTDLFEKVSLLFIKNFEEFSSNSNVKLQPAETLSSEFRPEDIWLGHSYFIQEKVKDNDGTETLVPEDFAVRLEYEIKPILLEYVKDGVLIGSVKDNEGKDIPVEQYIHNLS